MKTKFITCLCMFFSILMLGACAKDEETFTGNIIGKVTDSTNGEVMSGVTVTIIPGGTSRTTGSDGHFEFRDLEPKQYEIQAHKDGYSTNYKVVTVTIGYDTPGDIQLTPIAKEGQLALSTNTLNFGSLNTSMAFSIINNGNKAFNWNITGHDKVDWLSITPTSGSLQAGKSNAVTVTLNRDRITEYMEATIIINADNESMPLKITAEAESKTSKISLSSGTLNFGAEYSSLTFDIKNIGNAGDVDWTISGINEQWLTVTPTAGTTAMGKSSAVIVNVDRTLMPEGKYNTTILVNAEGESLKVTVNAEKNAGRYLEVFPSALTIGTNDNATLSIMSHNGNTAYKLTGYEAHGWASFDKTEGVISKFDASDANTIETLTLSVDRTGLAAGEYSFTLVIQSDLGNHNVPVTMTVEETQAGISGNAEIISCSDNLEFTLSDCKISGTTATIDLKVKNLGKSTIQLSLGGGYSWGYVYDDQGNKYSNNNLQVSLANNSYTTNSSTTDIPAGVMTKASIKISNISELSSIFTHINIHTNQDGPLLIKNLAIGNRTPNSLESPKTTGNVRSCSDNLEFTLLDCKYGTTYTTLSFRVKNIGRSTIQLNLGGGYSWGYAYDDQGNKYSNNDLQISLANNSYTANSSITDIPAGVMTYGNIRLTNVDVEASEFSNITLSSNQDGELVFTNVKIRK